MSLLVWIERNGILGWVRICSSATNFLSSHGMVLGAFGENLSRDENQYMFRSFYATITICPNVSLIKDIRTE
jgi:hypothetical protein